MTGHDEPDQGSANALGPIRPQAGAPAAPLTTIRGIPLLIPPFADGRRVVAAFSSRDGGVSAPPYASLNLGFATGDDPRAVVTNRWLLCRALGLRIEQLVVPSQVHGQAIAVVGERERSRGAVEPGSGIPATDALITGRPGVALFIAVADCAPVLIYDPVRHVAAAVHLGWRGAVARLGEAVIRRLADDFNCRPIDLRVAVGPAIGPCCYEVGDEVVAAVEAAFADSAGLFRPGGRERRHFDLPAAVGRQLVEAGVPLDQIWFAGCCTACDTGQWFSHRAEGAQTGRMAGIIAVLSAG